eukprot:gene8922-9874_t
MPDFGGNFEFNMQQNQWDKNDELKKLHQAAVDKPPQLETSSPDADSSSGMYSSSSNSTDLSTSSSEDGSNSLAGSLPPSSSSNSSTFSSSLSPSSDEEELGRSILPNSQSKETSSNSNTNHPTTSTSNTTNLRKSSCKDVEVINLDDVGESFQISKESVGPASNTTHQTSAVENTSKVTNPNENKDTDVISIIQDDPIQDSVQKNVEVSSSAIFHTPNEKVAACNASHSTAGPSTSPDSNAFKNKSAGSILDSALAQVLSVLPDVDEQFAKNLVLQNIGKSPDMIGNDVVEQLFMMPYPKSKKSTKIKTSDKSINYYDVKNLEIPSVLYQDQCLCLLQNRFEKISVADIRIALQRNKYHYAASVKYLHEAIKKGHHYDAHNSENKQSSIVKKLKVIKKRTTHQLPAVLEYKLQKEVDFLNEKEKNEIDMSDAELDQAMLNLLEDQDDGPLMECGCCFGEVSVMQMVQCTEGHLFCSECLKSYAKEAIYGSGKTNLSCMTENCDRRFPLSQMRKALPTEMLQKYYERLQDESIKMAGLPDLVRCPSCDYAAELPPNDKVFKCEKCQKETCRYCKEDWADHFGIPCSELEKTGEKNVRVSYEEKMSMAKIRKCSKCQCGFTKSDGCNKMTCRCGTTMCYICRKSSIGYQHFCNHPRDPGKTCKKCKNCSLWTNTNEDDERAIQELKREALQEVQKLQPTVVERRAGKMDEGNILNFDTVEEKCWQDELRRP